jgi:hypothetical protein
MGTGEGVYAADTSEVPGFKQAPVHESVYVGFTDVNSMNIWCDSSVVLDPEWPVATA